MGADHLQAGPAASSHSHHGVGFQATIIVFIFFLNIHFLNAIWIFKASFHTYRDWVCFVFLFHFTGIRSNWTFRTSSPNTQKAKWTSQQKNWIMHDEARKKNMSTHKQSSGGIAWHEYKLDLCQGLILERRISILICPKVQKARARSVCKKYTKRLSVFLWKNLPLCFFTARQSKSERALYVAVWWCAHSAVTVPLSWPPPQQCPQLLCCFISPPCQWSNFLLHLLDSF